MMPLFVDPIDVWLFRDGRPFDAGTQHRARSLFPPYPTVVQGMIRTHHLHLNQTHHAWNAGKIAELVGTAEDFKNFRMRGPFLAHYDPTAKKLTRYFRLPADSFPEKEESNAYSLSPTRRKKDVLTSFQADKLPQLLLPPDENPGKSDLGEWLSEESLLDYLQGKTVTPIQGNQLFSRENRFGTKLNGGTRSVETGMLYDAEFIRPCQHVGLYLEVDGYIDWNLEGLLSLGGEGRTARYQIVDAPVWPAHPTSLPKQFKMYFASPTFFEDGWRPINWNKFFSGVVHLQAVALRGYETIGGYDWAKHEDKPARRFVPAGSVYYFTCESGARLQPELAQKQNALTDWGWEIGFGQVFIHEWKGE